jgi:hypothetical protein
MLKEYEDLFPRIFSEMKGIIGSFRDMKNYLNPDDKPINRRPYHLNPKYKEKLCKELDQMMDDKIIFLMEESDWISPMVVSPKKTRDIQIYVDL